MDVMHKLARAVARWRAVSDDIESLPDGAPEAELEPLDVELGRAEGEVARLAEEACVAKGLLPASA